jgi:hypothetical protein
MQLICCAALAGCSGADEPATVKVPPRVPDVAPETPRPPVERPDIEDPEAPIARPGPGGVDVDQAGEGRADLRPEATSDPNGRPRRRLNVDQLANAVLQVSDGIGWYERQGNTDVDLFAQLASTLGKPDYIQNTEEDLEPTILFQKFLGDAARLSLQEGGRPFGLVDGLTFQIADVRQLRGRLGQSIPVGPNANVRAALGLFDRCPDTTQNFTLTGAVTFTRFGVERGDRVTGTIDRLEVRDGRPTNGSAGPVLGLLRGDFDFILRVGPPYQRFTR